MRANGALWRNWVPKDFIHAASNVISLEKYKPDIYRIVLFALHNSLIGQLNTQKRCTDIEVIEND